jgi:hypothetical protein
VTAAKVVASMEAGPEKRALALSVRAMAQPLVLALKERRSVFPEAASALRPA